MGFMLYTTHIIVSLFLILVVLLQQGKGADLSVFGGGGTMTAFGARGAASVLHRLTVGGFVVFIVTTLAIGVYQTKSGDNVLSTLPTAEESGATEVETPDTGLSGVLPEAESFESGEAEGADATTDDTTAPDLSEGTASEGSDATTPEASASESDESSN